MANKKQHQFTATLEQQITDDTILLQDVALDGKPFNSRVWMPLCKRLRAVVGQSKSTISFTADIEKVTGSDGKKFKTVSRLRNVEVV